LQKTFDSVIVSEEARPMYKKYLTPFLWILFSVVVYSPAFATTYYVDSSCSINGNGQGQTCASSVGGVGPFNSLANARSAVRGNQSDNSLLLKRGQTFSGQFTVGAYGTEGRPFTISSYGTGADPVISGGSSNIFIDSGSYVIINGFTCTGATDSGGQSDGAITVKGTASHITIQNNTVIGSGFSGSRYGIITKQATSYHTIANNTVHGFLDAGIIIIGSGSSTDSTRSTGNEVYGNNNSYNNGSGFYPTQMDNSIIHDNSFHDNASVGSAEEYGIGILSCSNNEFYNNRIYNNHNMGVQFYGGNPSGDYGPSNNNKFYRNWVYDNREGNGHGLNIAAVNGNYCQNNAVYYNIFTGNKIGFAPNGYTITGGLVYNNVFYGNTYGVSYMWYTTGGYTYKNNIFSSNTTNEFYAGGNPSLTHTNNLYYRSSGNTVSFNGTNYILSAVKTTWELSCQNTDPKFASSPQFHLSSNSPAINAGVNVGLTQDHTGNAIIGLPDIGAIEYRGPAPSPPQGLMIVQ
jgi:hypothetical protein